MKTAIIIAAAIGLLGLVCIGAFMVPATKQEPASVPFTQRFTMEEVANYRRIVSGLEEIGVVRDWSRDYAVVVGRTFSALEWEQKRGACIAIDIVRQSKGMQPDFRIYDAYTNRQVGRYSDGTLTWNGH